MDILSVMIEAPRLLDYLAAESVQALASTCTILRIWFRQRVTTVTIPGAGYCAYTYSCAERRPRLVWSSQGALETAHESHCLEHKGQCPNCLVQAQLSLHVTLGTST